MTRPINGVTNLNAAKRLYALPVFVVSCHNGFMSKKAQLALKVALEMAAVAAGQIIEDQQALGVVQLILIGIELIVQIWTELRNSTDKNPAEDPSEDDPDHARRDPAVDEPDLDDQSETPGPDDPAQPTP